MKFEGFDTFLTIRIWERLRARKEGQTPTLRDKLKEILNKTEFVFLMLKKARPPKTIFSLFFIYLISDLMMTSKNVLDNEYWRHSQVSLAETRLGPRYVVICKEHMLAGILGEIHKSLGKILFKTLNIVPADIVACVGVSPAHHLKNAKFKTFFSPPQKLANSTQHLTQC